MQNLQHVLVELWLLLLSLSLQFNKYAFPMSVNHLCHFLLVGPVSSACGSHAILGELGPVIVVGDHIADLLTYFGFNDDDACIVINHISCPIIAS